jgi:hypothetical protein
MALVGTQGVGEQVEVQQGQKATVVLTVDDCLREKPLNVRRDKWSKQRD